MRPPIVVGDDTEAVEVYPSMAAATIGMEATDVGLYRAWDSEGLVLVPTPLPSGRATFVDSDPPRYRPDQLREELVRTVRVWPLPLDKPPDWLARAPIAELIAALTASEADHKAKRREQSPVDRVRRALARLRRGATR